MHTPVFVCTTHSHIPPLAHMHSFAPPLCTQLAPLEKLTQAWLHRPNIAPFFVYIFFTEMPVPDGQKGSTQCFDAHTFPMAYVIYALDCLPPFEYVISLSMLVINLIV